MPEPEAPTYVLLIVILLSTCLVLLVALLALCIRISGKLTGLERRKFSENTGPSPAPTSLSTAETSSGGAFELFLSEDPARRELTKGEQFAAYRQWRQEKGMNWSNS